MILRWLAAIVLLSLLSACAGHRGRPDRVNVVSASAPQSASEPAETSRPQAQRYRQTRDGEAIGTIDVEKIAEPVPRDEPRSRYGNRSPYSVLGRSYTVLPSSKGYRERGIASWYGNKFHGYMTSSFEPYDMYQFSAAHKSLPLPSWAKVTNLANGKSVVVRVNDRGPFHENRLIDLSYAAAVKIGVWPAGTGMVEVEAIGPGDRVQTARTAAAHPAQPPNVHKIVPTARDAQIFLQVGSYAEAANAERARREIDHAGLGPVRVVEARVNGQRVSRVRIGPIKDAASADRLAEQVRRLGLGRPQVAID